MSGFSNHYLVLYHREGDVGTFTQDLDFIILHPSTCEMQLKHGELGDPIGRQVWKHMCWFEQSFIEHGAKAFKEQCPSDYQEPCVVVIQEPERNGNVSQPGS